MATPPTPAKPPAPTPPPNSQSKPPTPPETTQATQLHLNIHGIPPKPNMAPTPPVLEEFGEVVQAEMKAGRDALAINKARTDAEHEAGKRAIAHLNRNSQSKEEPPSQP